MIDVRVALTINDAQVEHEGKADEAQLKRVDLVTESDDEKVEATEYWLLVHRSVHVTKKQGFSIGLASGEFN